MTGRFICVAIVMALHGCGGEQTESVRSEAVSSSPMLIEGTAGEVGMSPSGLTDAVRIFRKAVDDARVTGVQLLVARKGRVVVHEALGWRDLEHQLPMERNTLVRMASNTKSVVAAGILKLADDGRLALSEPVSDYLPGFSKGLSAKLTIRDLLRHTTGFANQFDNYVGEVTVESEEFPDAPSLKIEAVKIGREGPEEEPGRQFQYNNWGYTVLGALIEEVSGQKVDQFLNAEFYVPLGMSDTSHALHGVDASRVSITYMKDSGEWEILPPESPPFVRTTGGLVSTASDFAKFCQMFLNGGRYGEIQLLRPATAREATSLQSQGPYQYISPQGTEALGLRPSWYNYRDSRELNLDIGYGYGWSIAQNGSFGHAGFRGTYAYADPKEDLVILVFAQSRAGGAPGQGFIDAVYDAIE